MRTPGSPGRSCSSGAGTASRSRLARSAHPLWARPFGPRGPEDGPPALVIPGFLATDRRRWTAPRAGAGRMAGASVVSGLNQRRQGGHPGTARERLDECVTDGGCWWSAGASAACSRVSLRTPPRQGARGGDAWLALLRRPQDQHQRLRILRADRRSRRERAALPASTASRRSDARLLVAPRRYRLAKRGARART